MQSVRRLGSLLLLLLGAATVVFFLIHLIPGDPAAAMLGEGAAPADVAALRSALGLDRPRPVQYASWLKGLAHGDLGASILTRRKVAEEIARAVPATAVLAVASFAAALLFAVPAGLLAAYHRGKAADDVLRVASLVGVSTPNYVSAPILVLIFSVGLGLLPVSGRDAPGALVLPAATMGLALAALLSRMIRASVAEELARPYVVAARARGETRWHATLRHAARNALPPVLVVAGLQFGSLLTGAVVTETIFSWPGVGRDVLARLFHGASVSLGVAGAAVALSAVFGSSLGLLAGERGGLFDAALGRLVDLVLAFPGLLLAVALAAVLGPSAKNTVVALSVVGWVPYARLARAEARRVSTLDFVAAARAAGARPRPILARHPFPNVAAPLVVQATLPPPRAILSASVLSF